MKNKKIYPQETIVNHLKNYGFVFANSEIYNGLANAWDYGPLGVLLKQNIKNLWWSFFVTKRPDMVGLDSSIIFNKQVWEASGHLSNFSDPLIDCKKCQTRYRADKLIEEFDSNIQISEATPKEELKKIIDDNKIICPNCKAHSWTDIRQFNLMFKTFQGVVEDKKNELYLRPETAQGIFLNYLNTKRAMRLSIPFGIAQIGKSFRNEITPGNFIFRTREFEQMEIEYFTKPQDADQSFEEWYELVKNFVFNKLNLNSEYIRFNEHKKEELSHYSKRTIDIQFLFAHGWSELWGIANRTDYDLKAHMNISKVDMTYLDPLTREKYIPYVIEPSVGVERLFYAIITNFFEIEQLENDEREIIHFPYALAPYKVAVLPLSNKLIDQAKEVYEFLLENNIACVFDKSGSIGKRYRRQDAIGTFFCVTIDFETINDLKVTIRNRDTMVQERILKSDLINYLKKHER